MIYDDFPAMFHGGFLSHLLQIWLRLAGRNLQVTGTACLVFLGDPERISRDLSSRYGN